MTDSGPTEPLPTTPGAPDPAASTPTQAMPTAGGPPPPPGGMPPGGGPPPDGPPPGEETPWYGDHGAVIAMIAGAVFVVGLVILLFWVFDGGDDELLVVTPSSSSSVPTSSSSTTSTSAPGTSVPGTSVPSTSAPETTTTVVATTAPTTVAPTTAAPTTAAPTTAATTTVAPTTTAAATTTAAPTTTVPSNVPVVTAPPNGGSLLDILSGNADLSGFNTIFQSVGDPAQVLTDGVDAPYTIFAPDNDAMAGFTPADEAAAIDFLQQHIVSGALSVSDLGSQADVQTLNGATLVIDAANATIGGSRVLVPDVEAVDDPTGYVNAMAAIVSPS